MENQKKNNSALIIVIVLICVFLFFALVGFGGYYAYKSIIKPKISETKKDITTPSTKDTKDETSSKSNSSSAKDAKVAGKDSPLAIKEWGLASKYAGKLQYFIINVIIFPLYSLAPKSVKPLSSFTQKDGCFSCLNGEQYPILFPEC